VPGDSLRDGQPSPREGGPEGDLVLKLAAAPAEETRDPGRALALLDQVFRRVRGDPVAFEIRAAAEASIGRFADAVNGENKAISKAQTPEVGRRSLK
jgi:hypothetical protein